MREHLLSDYLRLQMIVGALGEQCSPPWWRSEIFSADGLALLAEYLYPRTSVTAAASACAHAARLHHDPPLAGAPAYHLFRLPPDMEGELRDRRLADSAAIRATVEAVARRDGLVELLAGFGAAVLSPKEGPLRCGGVETVRTAQGPARLAAAYAWAFQHGRTVIPYFEAV